MAKPLKTVVDKITSIVKDQDGWVAFDHEADTGLFVVRVMESGSCFAMVEAKRDTIEAALAQAIEGSAREVERYQQYLQELAEQRRAEADRAAAFLADHQPPLEDEIPF